TREVLRFRAGGHSSSPRGDRPTGRGRRGRSQGDGGPAAGGDKLDSRVCESIGRPRRAGATMARRRLATKNTKVTKKAQKNLRDPRDTNALKFVFVTRKRVSVTRVTASLGHSAANAGDVSCFGAALAALCPSWLNRLRGLVAWGRAGSVDPGEGAGA